MERETDPLTVLLVVKRFVMLIISLEETILELQGGLAVSTFYLSFKLRL